MNRRLKSWVLGLASWVLVASLVGYFLGLFIPSRLVQGQGSPPSAIRAPDAPHGPLVDILSDPRFYEEIANPQLTSREQVEKQVARCERLLDEIKGLEGSPALALDVKLKANAEVATRLLARFLDFARSTTGREFVLAGEGLAIQVPRELDQEPSQRILERIQDAHARMRKQWRVKMKLDLPPGFIFIKLYESREQMTHDYALGPETAGVAFPCRYIAVSLPYPERELWGRMKQYFIGEEFQQTVAHEFVHSFCFMTLGYRRAGGLPRWFMEGFALHFSGEHRVRTAIEGPGGLTIRDFDSTEEYQDFKRLFQFMLEKYGPDRLYDFAQTSLERGSVAQSLPQILDLSNETALIAASVRWRREKALLQRRLILAVGALVLVMFAVFRGRWAGLRWMASLFVVGVATAYASRTPYYVHTLLWWVPGALFVPLVYLAVRYVRRRQVPEPASIRLVVGLDWPWLDELMEPWPYEEVDLAEIAETDTEFSWGLGERELKGADAWRVKDFLDSQPTNVFYFQGHAYRVWYEWLTPEQ